MATKAPTIKNDKAEDLTWRLFSPWFVLERCERPKDVKGGTFWLCECECGATRKPIQARQLKAGAPDCGCRKRRELIGKRFGRWVVQDVRMKKKGLWALCLCDCGTLKEVIVSSLRIGQSSGCFYCARGYDDRELAPANKVLCTYRREARERGLVWELDAEFARELLKAPCHYCGAPPSNYMACQRGGTFNYNGIDRVDNQRDYTVDNVVTACRICNIAKHTFPRDLFLATIKRIYEHMRLEDQVFDITPIDLQRLKQPKRPNSRGRSWGRDRLKNI